VRRWLHKRSGLINVVLLAVGLLLILGSLFLLSTTTENSAAFDRLHVWLLLLNVTGAVVLTLLIAYNLTKLVSQYRRSAPGSRLTARLVSMFTALAVAPVLVVYFFSFQFISRGIDSWFDVRVERAVGTALELSRDALDVRMRELLARAQDLTLELRTTPDAALPARLASMRERVGATELTVFGPDGRIVATAAAESAPALPDLPPDDAILQARSGQAHVGLDPAGDDGLFVRAIVPLRTSYSADHPRFIQALFPIAARQGALAETVQQEFVRYQQLELLRQPLKYTFILTLSLVLLVSLLTAVWGGFWAARRVVRPIQDLAEGTRAVARGDYDTRLPMPARDDVGFLVLSFNEMTARLADARESAKRSQAQVEGERAFLEAVLVRLSSGVIVLDADLRIRTGNAAALGILGAELSRVVGKPFARLRGAGLGARQFVDAIEPKLVAGARDWREEVVIKGEGAKRILTCSATTLPGALGDGRGQLLGGTVLVFDELTALVQAQRDAAWGEVARRLAHEIKNPLTPIQLAAERLRLRLLDKLESADAEVLARSTHTIVQQVEALQEMVKAFSEYARAPQMEVSRFSLGALVSEVAELYRERPGGARVRVQLDTALPHLEADSNRVRQMLHNLIKNAQEALEGRKDGEVVVTTRLLHEREAQFAELMVEDNGPGFEPTILEAAFEPYVTSKPKGTGLGLAIVKKLAEEHGGSLAVTNRPEGGARIVVRLPLDERASERRSA
jgi:nitrogen fixation/metabolism regulation signal transduction histidine kinase